MADYICKHCKFNNNGWCVALKKNKLSQIIECTAFNRGKYGNFEAEVPVKKSQKRYRVNFEGCYYDDMDGYEIESDDNYILLEFNIGMATHKAMFFRHQLQYKGEV